MDRPAEFRQRQRLVQVGGIFVATAQPRHRAFVPPFRDGEIKRLARGAEIVRYCRFGWWVRQRGAADCAVFVGRLAGQERDAVRIGDQHPFGAVLPGLLQRVELDAHQRDAERRTPIVDRFGDVVAHALADGIDAQIGAAPGFDRLEKIRPVSQIASDNHLIRIRAGCRQDDPVPPNYVQRAGVGLGDDTLELVIDLVELRAIQRVGKRAAHVGIERQHDRQVVLAVDLGTDRACDQLDAGLGNGLQRAQPVFAPEVLRDERGKPDDSRRCQRKKRRPCDMRRALPGGQNIHDGSCPAVPCGLLPARARIL